MQYSWQMEVVDINLCACVYIYIYVYTLSGLPRWHYLVKNLPANVEDLRDKYLIPGLGRSPGGGHGNLL